MTSTIHRRRILQLGAAGLGALAAPMLRAQAPTKIRFTLDFRISGQTAPFLVALYKGYYQAEGLDVTIDVGSGSVASITRVASGAYDLGFGDISSLIEFQATAKPAHAFACRRCTSTTTAHHSRSSAARTGASPPTSSSLRRQEASRPPPSSPPAVAWPMVAKQAAREERRSSSGSTTDFSLARQRGRARRRGRRHLLPRLGRFAVRSA